MSNLSSGAFLKTLGNFLADHQQSFLNGILVTVTLGGEQAFRIAAFNCPCGQPNAFYYGISFLCGPAFVLMVLGILVNNLTWRLCQGCVYRSASTYHGCTESCRNCTVVFSRAIVAPAAWLFVALLDGNYYVCLMSTAPCETESEENRTLTANSQIISWLFLTIVISIASAVILYNRCTDKLTFLHSRYMSIYRDVERDKLEDSMKEKASLLADTNIKLFFEQKVISKNDWDCISMAPIQRTECGVTRESEPPIYTPLHRWTKALECSST